MSRRTIRLTHGRTVVLKVWGTAVEDKLENLVCCDAAGAELWRAKLPDNVTYRDCFTSLSYQGATLVAGTFSGYAMTLCPETGHCISRLRVG